MKKTFRIAALVMLLVLALGPVASFAASYVSYTYSYDGDQLVSPDGYTPDRLVSGDYMGLSVDLSEPTDIVADTDGNIYIADPKNNRIVILDKYYKLVYQLQGFVNDQGIDDSLAGARGLCVTEDKIYVADTDKKRILVFGKYDDEQKKCPFVARLEEPESESFAEDDVYMPIAVAADVSGRIYVVSATTYEGIIAMNPDGTFSGFVGAQKVVYSALEIAWRRFQTKEQRENTKSYISTEYNNIDIDADGFVYVTTSSIEEAKQQEAIKSKSGDYAPVKKLNTAGNDVMRRNGFFAPNGEVSVLITETDKEDDNKNETDSIGASVIVDVAPGPEGTWSIIDQRRSRVFTYNQDGELLFAFGDKGEQLGNLDNAVAITYQGDKLLALDSRTNAFTVYTRTEYGDILISAIKANNDRRYDEASTYWQKILQRNNNFDSAYVGLGKASYRSGKWEEAMNYYKYCLDTADYSEAFKMWRKDWVEKYVWIIPIFVIVVIFLLVRFFGYAGKVNKRAATSGEKKTLKHELLYAFHLMLHPFDGFWDLKHEKRGSLRAALIYLALTVLAFTYNGIGQSYIYNPKGATQSIFLQIASVVLPVILWVAANWCFTTLFEGEGSAKDILIATCYALVPIPMLLIPATMLTHVLALSESGFVSLITGIMWVWVGLLIFFGSMITHDYTLGKNVLMTIATIIGMTIIMFLGILFSMLVTKMIMFVSNIVTEVSYRM